MGLGTARACVQSKGRLVRDQMTGWTFCVMFSEMATMEHVSCRTATRLGTQRHVSQGASHSIPRAGGLVPVPNETHPRPRQLRPRQRGLTRARSGWARTG